MGLRPAELNLFIAGPSGAGKSTLGSQLGARFCLPVHPLDAIAFSDSHWTIRPLTEKVKAVEAILNQPGWIAEGGHMGWTQSLLDAATVIISLQVPLRTTLRRRTRRLRSCQLIRESPQIWWQVRWYVRRYRRGQDLDSHPSSAAIEHFLRPSAAKVIRYRCNPSPALVAATIEKMQARLGTD